MGNKNTYEAAKRKSANVADARNEGSYKSVAACQKAVRADAGKPGEGSKVGKRDRMTWSAT